MKLKHFQHTFCTIPVTGFFVGTLFIAMLLAGTLAVADTNAVTQNNNVTLRVEPFIPTNLGDRVIEPTTIHIDAPGADVVKVYLQPVDQPYGGKAISKPKLIGRDGTAGDGFSVPWQAQEPYEFVELFAIAYKKAGKASKSNAKTKLQAIGKSSAVNIILDWRQRQDLNSLKTRSSHVKPGPKL